MGSRDGEMVYNSLFYVCHVMHIRFCSKKLLNLTLTEKGEKLYTVIKLSTKSQHENG